MKKLTLIIALVIIGLITSAQIDGEMINPHSRSMATPFYEKNITSTEYFHKASTNLVVGAVCTFVAGPILMYVSTTLPVRMQDDRDINNMPSKTIFSLGVATSLYGAISTIVGSVQIGKAGTELEKERKKFLSLSDNGVGVKLNF
jgi:hypothetical protein